MAAAPPGFAPQVLVDSYFLLVPGTAAVDGTAAAAAAAKYAPYGEAACVGGGAAAAVGGSGGGGVAHWRVLLLAVWYVV